MGLISHHYHPSFRLELLRLAKRPTAQEVEQELPECAREVLEAKGDWNGGRF